MYLEMHTFLYRSMYMSIFMYMYLHMYMFIFLGGLPDPPCGLQQLSLHFLGPIMEPIHHTVPF